MKKSLCSLLPVLALAIFAGTGWCGEHGGGKQGGGHGGGEGKKAHHEPKPLQDLTCEGVIEAKEVPVKGKKEDNAAAPTANPATKKIYSLKKDDGTSVTILPSAGKEAAGAEIHLADYVGKKVKLVGKGIKTGDVITIKEIVSVNAIVAAPDPAKAPAPVEQ